jgi:hypothetical protein
MAWGPPNFGEHPKTDSRYALWIVQLDYSVSVVTGEEIGMPVARMRVREIQIRRGSRVDADIPHLLGKHVVVRGRLFTQVFPGDNTPVVMEASALKIGGPVACGG